MVPVGDISTMTLNPFKRKTGYSTSEMNAIHANILKEYHAWRARFHDHVDSLLVNADEFTIDRIVRDSERLMDLEEETLRRRFPDVHNLEK